MRREILAAGFNCQTQVNLWNLIMSEKYNLTPVELELMGILWNIGQGTVHDIMAHLPEGRSLAYTSVSTILRILQQKNILTAKKMGRQHIYLPTFSKKTFATHAVKKIVAQIFSGNSVELVAYLIDKKDLSLNEIAAMQKLLDTKKTEIM
jgi:predicted transcriptional regulator